MNEAANVRLLDKIYIDDNGCWIWTSVIHKQTGYARFKFNGKMEPAHRVSYWLFVGEIPEGLDIDHLCRVRHCVNYNHLEPVTRQENLRRGENYRRNKTHCPSGHEYSTENTYIYQNRRYCRECGRIDNRKRYWEKKLT